MTTPNPDRAEIVERLNHCSRNTRDEYMHELTGRAADLIEQDGDSIKALGKTARVTMELLIAAEARIAKLTEALDGATKVIEGYVGFLHRLPACDLELHPYIPGVEDALDAAREALADIPPESQDIR